LAHEKCAHMKASKFVILITETGAIHVYHILMIRPRNKEKSSRIQSFQWELNLVMILEIWMQCCTIRNERITFKICLISLGSSFEEKMIAKQKAQVSHAEVCSNKILKKPEDSHGWNN
jgi:hypothetical protein